MDKKIRDICRQWRQETTTEAGGIIISQEAELLHLYNNNIEPHLLNFEQLITLGAETGKNLLLGNMSTIITKDHYLFWSWSASILLGHYPGVKRTAIYEDDAIHALLATCLSCNLGKISINDPYILPPASTSIISSHMGFPLLEGMCRKVLSEHLTRDGITIKPFTVRKIDGSNRTYKIGERCNSLSHALSYASSSIRSKQISESLSDLLNSLEKQSIEDKAGHEYIFHLRNQALHGDASPETIGGTLLTAAILLALSFVEEQYEERRKGLKHRIAFGKSGGHRLPGWPNVYADLCRQPLA